ncbi:MAG: hypothetical protein Q8R83_11590 [Legionellaceae bacterium]|nr:hypothetical protein [Legionellaceae bacterium]
MFNRLEELNKKMRDMESLTQDEAYNQQWIKTCEAKHFPAVVQQVIEKQLTVRSKSDIPRVLSTLYQLRQGVVAKIWDNIKLEVTLLARRQCGTIFPEQSIEAGRTMPVNFEYLKLVAANNICNIDDNHELYDEVQLAYQITEHSNDSKLQAYLDAHPIVEVERSEQERIASFKKEYGPSTSELMGDIAQSLGKLADTGVDFLNLVTGNKGYFSKPNNSSFFANNPGKQGCEPPPGSYLDEHGNVVAPAVKAAGNR